MKLKVCFLAISLLVLGVTTSFGSGAYKVVHKEAIVLAMFGTTVDPALKSLLNIREKIEQQYPGIPVRVAFTSNIIRKKWQHRAEAPLTIRIILKFLKIFSTLKLL